MATPGHSGAAQLSTAMSHEQTLVSGRDYYAAAAAPRWSDTLNFLAHREKEPSGIKKSRHVRRSPHPFFFFFALNEAPEKKGRCSANAQTKNAQCHAVL